MKALNILLLVGILSGCASTPPAIKTEVMETPGAVTEVPDQRVMVTPEELPGTWICTQSLELFYVTPQLGLEVYSWEGEINNENWERSELTFKLVAYKSHELTQEGDSYVNNDPVNAYKATAVRVADDVIEWNDGLYINVKLIKINVEKEVYAGKKWNPFTIEGLKEKVQANR